jgi:PPOX class probable F420-dependent enzyme
VEMKPELLQLIDEAYYVWFSTVRADGMPQPTPVWFIRDGDTFLIYSMPDAQKIHNIRQNPHVALSVTGDSQANRYVVIMGTAEIEENGTPPHLVPAYMQKYAEGVKELGYTPEQFGQGFTTTIRVKVNRVRGDA